MRTAAALIIGNEILSGKISDANLGELARTMRALGITLARANTVPDVREVIVSEVRALSARFDFVFTSGGVGPTHDDVTVDAVAEAFETTTESSPAMEELLRGYYADRLTDAHLRMARVPRGARLVRSKHIPWPTVVMKNVWILPGVPEIFAMKMAVVRDELGGDEPFVSLAVLTQLDEGELKPILDAVVAQFAGVDVGSYPRFRDPTCRTKLTFDGLDRVQVTKAREAFLAAVPADQIVTEQPTDATETKGS